VPTECPTQWIPEALPPGIRRPGSKADHSPHYSRDYE